MGKEKDYFPDLSKLLKLALGDLLEPSANTLLDMCSDDIIFEFPYALPNGVSRVDGKENLDVYLSSVSEFISIETMTLISTIKDLSSGIVAIEFQCHGTNNQTGYPYNQNYISVITIRDGHISRYRDYWNPFIFLSSAKGDDWLEKSL